MGTSVSSAGDLNGDGHADLVVNAMGASPVGAFLGAVYIYHGPLVSVPWMPSAVLENPSFRWGLGFGGAVTTGM